MDEIYASYSDDDSNALHDEMDPEYVRGLKTMELDDTLTILHEKMKEYVDTLAYPLCERMELEHLKNFIENLGFNSINGIR